MKKATKKEMFNQLKANYDLSAELVAFIDHEVELLDKKNSKKSNKPTKTQIANAELANEVLDFVAASAEPVTIAMLVKQFDVTSQKVTPILSGLVDAGKLAKEVIKRVGYFTAV